MLVMTNLRVSLIAFIFLTTKGRRPLVTATNHQKSRSDLPKTFSGIPQAVLSGSISDQHRLDQSTLHTLPENEYALKPRYHFHHLLADDELHLFPRQPPLYCIDNTLTVQCVPMRRKSKIKRQTLCALPDSCRNFSPSPLSNIEMFQQGGYRR